VAGRAQKGSTLSISTGLTGSDYLISVTNATANAPSPNNAIVSIANLLANSNVAIITIGNNALSTANLIVRAANSIPANSSANGVAGQVIYSNTYLYICLSNNNWVRTPLNTF
jgi:hypothetical protein